MSNATLGFGSIFSLDNGSSFTAVAEVKEVSGPGLSRATVEVTNHASPSAAREYIAGLIDAGEITLGLSWLPGNTQHSQILTDFTNGTLRNVKITLPSSAGSKVWTAAVIFTKYDPSYQIDGVLGLQVTMKVSGMPTFA